MARSDADEREAMRHLLPLLREWGAELGFQFIGTSRVELGEHPSRLLSWLDEGLHGDMGYMARNVEKRADPTLLVPETRSVISARMNYMPQGRAPGEVLASPGTGYISRYALGRDYHKLVRRRLLHLTRRLQEELGDYRFTSRPFCDSAPVLEKAIGEQAGAGWIGKNTLLIDPDAGSWFFLGEIYTDLPLPTDPAPQPNRCGSCRACLDRCPTGAFLAPYRLDANRCISYLTIEHHGSIPAELRPLMGNRIFGCDDCQLVCPWNRGETRTAESDFAPRHELDGAALRALFTWSEETWLEKTTGSALRRTGYLRWIRNVAVALGNAPASEETLELLERRMPEFPDWIAEHIEWAAAQQRARLGEQGRSRPA